VYTAGYQNSRPSIMSGKFGAFFFRRPGL
jgi:hypothetical protein